MTVGGTRLSLRQEDVVGRLAEVEPGPIRTHAVQVEGKLYPVKQAFAEVTGLDVLDFNTSQARWAFQRLGFHVVRVA